MANQHPIILVHGIFGYGPNEVLGFPYWGQAFDAERPPGYGDGSISAASVGPLSSNHDRACELFAQIKGGEHAQVDYGEEHANKAGHERKGKIFESKDYLYPDWSEENPIHLVGHSQGGATIRMLQYLLHIDYWKLGTSANWIKSITGISPVFNGSTLTYMFGCDQNTGAINQSLRGEFLTKALKALAALTDSRFKDVYDFDLVHWHQEPRAAGESWPDYLSRIANSDLFEGEDNAIYSLTIQNMRNENNLAQTFPNTYYFSHVTEQTFKVFLWNRYLPQPGMNPLFMTGSAWMGCQKFADPFYPGFKNEDWWENDGAVPTYSQMYPRSAGHHPVAGEFTDTATDFHPGRWYWQYLHGFDHLDIVMLPEPGQIAWQRNFYARLFRRLAAL